jgi:hypothetical protein
MGLLSAVADVLEKIAEEAKVARPLPLPNPVVDKAEERVKAAADKVRTVTGKEPSREAARKVAEDKELLDIIDKVAAEKMKPTPMGGPSEEKVASTSPSSEKQERIASAWDSWGAGLTRN